MKQETNIVKLINEINKMPEDSLLEKMISYCEQTDTDPQELGDIFAESEQFKRKLWISCVEFNQIKDDLLSDKLNLIEDIDEW